MSNVEIAIEVATDLIRSGASEDLVRSILLQTSEFTSDKVDTILLWAINFNKKMRFIK
jgi:hypothetical protein